MVQVLIVLAGVGAGAVNTMVGSGSLISYPIMVALGIPPVTANVANSVGLTPGSIAGAWGYRSELRGVPPRPLWMLAGLSAAGGAIGAALLTVAPETAFEFVVPVLILAATVLMALQPRIATHDDAGRTQPVALAILVLAAAISGGSFSAAQGIVLLGILGLCTTGGIQRHNAIKNLLQAIVNLVASVYFVVTGAVAWDIAGLLAAGAIVGAIGGAAVGKRIPERPLRIAVVIFGLVVTGVLGYQALFR